MLFNSYEFIFIYLPITFFIYFYLNHKRLTQASKVFLVLSSLFFYGWWNIIYIPLLVGSMIFNYLIGSRLSKIQSEESNVLSKNVLIFSIGANISLLAYFKYADFLIDNINYSIGSDIESLNLALPLAISFFSFQQIAYLVDSFRHKTRDYDFIDYAIFVTFFPQLIAGPIVHHNEMMPQFSQYRNKIINYRNIVSGLFMFSIGLFKKTVIADTFSVWATEGFDIASTLSFFEAWATSLSYTFQLYFDFSGYTDMALGLALLFNIKLPINFNSPYKATDIQDFWRRWHITLSRFLRDYVYIPLGGSRKGSFVMYVNLMTTFVLGGLWHGAGWTFVFWGFIHGCALIVHRIWSLIGFKLPSWIGFMMTFNFINLSWVFFRAKEWKDAIKVLNGMIDLNDIVLTQTFISIYNNTVKKISFMMPDLHASKNQVFLFDFNTFVWIITIFFIVIKCQNSYETVFCCGSGKQGVITKMRAVYFAFLLMFSILYMSLTTHTEFIYFNF